MKFTSELPPEEFDLQIRFWFWLSGNRKKPIVDLLILSTKGKVVKAQSYSFIKDKPTLDSFNLTNKIIKYYDSDSLLKSLNSDSLFQLKSLSNGEIKKLVIQNHSQEPFIKPFDGDIDYNIEIFTKNKGKKIVFNCPFTFYKEYKLKELDKPVKVISALIKIMGFDRYY